MTLLTFLIVLVVLLFNNAEFVASQVSCPAPGDVSLTCDTNTNAQQRDDCVRVQQTCVTNGVPSGWVDVCAMSFDATGMLTGFGLGTQSGYVDIKLNASGVCARLCGSLSDSPCLDEVNLGCLGVVPVADPGLDLCQPMQDGRLTCTVKALPAPPGPCVQINAPCPSAPLQGWLSLCSLQLQVAGTCNFAISLLNGALVLQAQLMQPNLCFGLFSEGLNQQIGPACLPPASG